MDSKNKIYYLWFGLFFLVIVFGVFIVETNKSKNSLMENNSNINNEVPDNSVEKINIVAANFSFEPKEIRVKKGQKIDIVLSNKEGFHDFVLDEFNARTKPIGANQTAEAVFTPDKTGEFEFYCSVGNHRQMGMIGKLIVE